jgi:Restriction endonuclease S subunits
MSTNLFNPSDHRRYPQRWPLFRGKQLFQIIDKHSEEGIEELLSVSHITGITPRSQKNVTMFQSESLVGYKLCQVGDIAANTMWTWQGAIGVSNYAGVVSPAYNVYRQNGDIYNSRFLDMLLRERRLVGVYHSLSTGIRPSRLRLYPDTFLTIRFPVPPREEQDHIVRYLDWVVSGINRLISNHKKEIELLNEMKQKLIDKAVISGVRDSVLVHNDDIRWDIDYPAHWQLQRIRESFGFKKGLSITKANLEDSGIAVISYGQVHSKKNSGMGLNNDLIRYVNESYLTSNQSCLVRKGDFIFADTSEDIAGCGNCAYIDWDDTIFAGYHSIIAHPNGETDNKYLAYLFQSPTWRYQIRKKVNGVKVYSITQKMLKDAFILIPSIDEQEEIIVYLDRICLKIEVMIEKVNGKISNLQDLKNHLISDVITGKIDVRDIEIPDYEYVADETDTDLDEDSNMEKTDEQEE